MNKVPIVLGLFLIASFYSPARAVSSVVINELLPQPTSGEDDWIELFNPGSETIALEGWKLTDKGTVTPIKVFGATDQISPGEFLVIDVSNRLNNSTAEEVSLLKNDGSLTDSYSYPTSALGTSFGRTPDAGSTWVSFPAPSKGSTNGSGNPVNTPSPTVSTSGLSLSEFYPHPHSGEQEWVEIYNDNVTTLSLNGFKIDDSEGGSLASTLVDETIPPKGYFYIQFDSKLNNGGDTVRFLSPEGSLIDSFTYSQSTQGNSWAKKSSGWEETITPTRGQANLFSQTLASTSTPTPTKKAVTESPKKPTSSPTLSKDIKTQVLGEETATSSPTTATNKIKLSFEDDEKDTKVLGESTNNYLSWGLILLGLIVVALPIIIVIRKKRG